MNGRVVDTCLLVLDHQPLTNVESVRNTSVLEVVSCGLIAEAPDVKGRTCINCGTNITLYVARRHVEPVPRNIDHESGKHMNPLSASRWGLLDARQRDEVPSNCLVKTPAQVSQYVREVSLGATRATNHCGSGAREDHSCKTRSCYSARLQQPLVMRHRPLLAATRPDDCARDSRSARTLVASTLAIH